MLKLHIVSFWTIDKEHHDGDRELTPLLLLKIMFLLPNFHGTLADHPQHTNVYIIGAYAELGWGGVQHLFS